MVPCHSYCSSCFRNTELLGTFPNDNGSEISRLFRKVGSQIFKNRNGSCHCSYCSSSGSKQCDDVWYFSKTINRDENLQGYLQDLNSDIL